MAAFPGKFRGLGLSVPDNGGHWHRRLADRLAATLIGASLIIGANLPVTKFTRAASRAVPMPSSDMDGVSRIRRRAQTN
jgi:hypothetical protein